MTAGSALAFAFGAGLTTFAAPCVFPLLPGYVAFYADRHGGRGETYPLWQGLAAAAGVLVVFAALTAGVYAVDTHLVASVAGLEPVAGGVLVALGLVTAAGRAPSVRVSLPRRRGTLPGVFAFGAAYAVAAAGCTVPVLLAVVAQAIAMTPLSGATVVTTYAVGVALPMVGTTVAAGYGADLLTGATDVSGTAVTRIAGGVMVCAGAVQLWAGLSVGW
ncbi:cytochrome c biogenesis CcdA family protein [Haloarcula sediminis]|uniref:cytochrome c biogenesis CcdA family protein n=1 Tax=Haloarcula sediminis TaxID=3111777 RepID=UPI002D79919D|nr:cytochrome c biogenesis protein CcdA [Haloarcula sp. CK38]